MSYQNPNQPKARDPSFNQKMYKLGMAMDELRQIYILGICLSWLIIPAILLLIKYIKYIVALNDVKQATSNENVNKGVQMILISILISFLSGLITGANEWGSIVGIVSFVLLFIGYTRLEDWSQDLYLESQSPNHSTMKSGFYDIKIAMLLHIIFIGIFMMPGALRTTSQAILSEYASPVSSSQTISTGNTPSYQQSPPQNTAYQYGQPSNAQPSNAQPSNVQPSYVQASAQPNLPGDPSTPDTNVGFCPYCGGKLPSPNAKFCANCGQQL